MKRNRTEDGRTWMNDDCEKTPTPVWPFVIRGYDKFDTITNIAILVMVAIVIFVLGLAVGSEFL